MPLLCLRLTNHFKNVFIGSRWDNHGENSASCDSLSPRAESCCSISARTFCNISGWPVISVMIWAAALQLHCLHQNYWYSKTLLPPEKPISKWFAKFGLILHCSVFFISYPSFFYGDKDGNVSQITVHLIWQ